MAAGVELLMDGDLISLACLALLLCNRDVFTDARLGNLFFFYFSTILLYTKI